MGRYKSNCSVGSISVCMKKNKVNNKKKRKKKRRETRKRKQKDA